MKKKLIIVASVLSVILMSVYIFLQLGISPLTSIELPGKPDNTLLFNIESLGGSTVTDVNETNSIGISRVGFQKVISIGGWIVNPNVVSNDNKKTYFVLDSENKDYVFKIRKDDILRPDVSTVITDKKIDDNHGFLANIPISKIEDDYYRIGFYRNDLNGKHLSYSNQGIEVSEGNFMFGLYSPYSKSIDINLMDGNRHVTGNIEVISLLEPSDNLIVNGWGIIDSIDSKKSKIFIILSNQIKSFVFEPSSHISRPDVTSAQSQFNMSGLDLDNSGFASKIKLSKLETGKYSVGIMIRNDQFIGYLYSDKSVELLADGSAVISQ